MPSASIVGWVRTVIAKIPYGRTLLAPFVVLLAFGPVRAEDVNFDIDVQSRYKALLALAEMADVQIAFAPGDDAMAEEAPPLHGTHSVEQALEHLLKDSDLTYNFITDDFVVVGRNSPQDSHQTTSFNDRRQQQGRSFGTYLVRLQQTASMTGQTDVSGPGQDTVRGETGDRSIEEIIVTATKRNESISDLPMSITAISGMDIERRSLVSMVDYLSVMPGVNMTDKGAGRNSIIIRGIAARPEVDRNVGVYLGEVPIGGLALFGNADIKLVDMERIEVLRGPQGTLYGSSSMSGTVRTIPVAPELAEFEGGVQMGYSHTAKNGAGNHMFQGILNIPIVEDKLALRGVAYRFEESGIYTNSAADFPITSDLASTFGVPELAQNQDDVGSQQFSGGRLAALWQPTENLLATATYISQKLEQNGFPEEWVDVGKFQQARLQIAEVHLLELLHTDAGKESLLDDIEIVNLDVDYDFGWASLVSSSSWMKETSTRHTDATIVFGTPVTQPQTQQVDAFIQEVRLTSQLEGPLQFLVGAYREEIDSDTEFTNHYSGDPALNPRTDIEFFTGDATGELRQTAFFGELGYDITDSMTLTVGGRSFSYERVTSNRFSGAIPGTTPLVVLDSDEADQSYKWNLTYRPNNDSMVYAQWVQGFRLGGPQNPLVRPDCDLDQDGFVDGSNVPSGISEIESDSLENYELGGKFQLLDGKMALHMAAYRINWEKIPVRTFFDCGAEITINAGGARSQGAELEGSVYVTNDLRLDFGASYVDPELTEDAFDLGQAGDRLPGSPNVNYNIGAQYDFDIGDYSSYIRADWSYVGGYYNNFEEEGTEVGDYHLLNARMGIALDRFTVDLYARNLANEDTYSWILRFFSGRRAYRLRPRTIGLEIGYRF